jgi:hypothetical protein
MLNQLLKLILSHLVEHLIKSLVSPSMLRVQYVLHQITSVWDYKIRHTCFDIRVPLFCKRFFGLSCTHSSDKLNEINWETLLSMYLKFQNLKWVSFTLKNLMWTCTFVYRQLVLTCNQVGLVANLVNKGLNCVAKVLVYLLGLDVVFANLIHD